MRWRVKGRFWVSREGGGERYSGDTVHSVKGKVGLSPYAQQPRNSATELFTRSFFLAIHTGKGDITSVLEC